MIKTYLKTLWRMFAKHVTRFVSLVFMVLISVGFCSGVGSSTDKINKSLDEYYRAKNVGDFVIKSTAEGGFTQSDVDKARELFGENAVINTGNSIDISVGEKRSVRYYFLDFDNWTVSVPDIIEGEKSDGAHGIYVENPDNVLKGEEVGARQEIDFADILIKLAEQNGKEIDPAFKKLLEKLEPEKVTVSAVIQSPLTIANDGEPSYNNDGAEVPDTTVGTADMDCLENIYYVSKDLIPSQRDLMSFLPDTPLIADGDIYVAVGDRDIFGCFSARYKTFTDGAKESIASALPGAEVLTLYENYSFKSLYSYSEKVEGIGYILMVAFLIVTALVVLSNMTRLIEEERPQIACLKTLGYSSTGIISKYLLFALIATGLGGGGAYFVGIGLAYLICYVFNYSFFMPPISSSVAIVFYIIAFTLIVVSAVGATALAGYKLTGSRPASLLRPKPPRAGKKVIIEKIPFIWNRLSFKYKSTVRNVLRYKSRFFMTVISVAFSTALVMAGLGILDMCLFHDFGSAAIMGIALVIVAFAGLLTAVVIYTLTNINISERNREIATLMVLGYYDKEVTGYIYREVYINSVIGIIFGYPMSALLLLLVFNTMGFGTLGAVSWFMWLVLPFIVLLFTGAVTLILRRKIVKIDMNESLKAIE